MGEDGYYVAGAQGSEVMPNYVSTYSVLSTICPCDNRYYQIDNPATTPGANPSLIYTGTFNQNAGTGYSAPAISFTLGSNVPSTFQIGLMVDNVDYKEWDGQSVTVSDSNSSATVSLPAFSVYNDLVPDWVFFDVSGATAGETITVSSVAGYGANIQLGAIAFNTDIPEPASLLLLGGGAAGVAAIRRRRRAPAC